MTEEEQNTIHDVSIVIVDDEPEIVKLLADLVKDSIRDVYTFTSSLEAQKFLREKDVDIAILDINMPGVDGITLLRELKLNKPATACIVHSGYFNNENMRIAVQHEAFDVLIKPADIDDFKISIMRCIQKIKTERVLNEILELLMYATSSKLKKEDFLKLSSADRSKILGAMLGVLRAKMTNKKFGGAA